MRFFRGCMWALLLAIPLWVMFALGVATGLAWPW